MVIFNRKNNQKVIQHEDDKNIQTKTLKNVKEKLADTKDVIISR